jgi:hypothetical protein
MCLMNEMQITTQYMAFVTLRLRSATFVKDVCIYTQNNLVVIIPLIAIFIHATREREKNVGLYIFAHSEVRSSLSLPSPILRHVDVHNYIHTTFHFHQSLEHNGIEYNAHHKNKSD